MNLFSNGCYFGVGSSLWLRTILWEKDNFVVQSPSCVWIFMTPCPATHQSSLSFTISQSLPKFMSIESVMLSSHLILYHPLLLLPSIFPSIGIFSNKSALCIGWSKCWSFSFSISPSNDWFDLLAVQGTGVFSSTTVQRHEFFGALPSLRSSSHNHTWPLGRP